MGYIGTKPQIATTLADNIVTADKISDGAVGTNDLANGAVTDAKIASMVATKLTGQVPRANAPSGSVISVSYFENSTRTAFGSVVADCFGTLTVSKSLASSYLLIDATVMSKGVWSYANNWYVVVNGVTFNGRGGWVDTANSGTNNSSFTRGTRVGPVRVANNLAAGNYTINVYIRNQDSGVFDSVILNPNSSDDTRYSQQVSSIQVMEIAA